MDRFTRRWLMEGILATVAMLFGAVSRAERDGGDGLVAKVVKADSVAGTAEVVLSVMPRETRFALEGDVRGLSEGDFFTFHIRKNAVMWKGREIHIRRVEFVP